MFAAIDPVAADCDSPAMKGLAEFELAAACCRWPPGPERSAAVRAAAGRGVDWAHFEKVVRRHRIEPLSLHGLEEAGLPLPDGLAARLRQEADRTRRENLHLAAECERLQRHLGKAGIPFLFVKGLALAPLAYGGIELKKGWDIDLLVDPDDFGRAGLVLEAVGYRRTWPPPDSAPERLESWQATMKEMTWTHAGSGVPVELHNSLVDNPRLLPGLSTGSPRQQVEVLPGITLPTLATDELFAYLCVHGASSAWFRLKWIADLAAFISGLGQGEVERLYRRSIELGSGRAAAVALLLVERLFGRPLPPGLMGLRRDPIARLLVRASLVSMTRRRATAEPSETKSGTLAIHLVQLLAMPGWTYLSSEVRRQAFSPMDELALGLPRGLRFLYPLLVVPLWLRRRMAGPVEPASPPVNRRP